MKETLAFVAAGVAALITRAALRLVLINPTRGATLSFDPPEIVFITGIVFFAVLVLLGRQVFQNDDQATTRTPIDKADFAPGRTPQEVSDSMARLFGGVTDEASRRRAIRDWLLAVPQCTVLIPMIFYLRSGEVGPLGWGLTVFFDVYCLLWAIGLYFRPRTEYHTPVRLRGDWLDRVGAFWLVGCAFGPLFGWLVIEAFPITANTWQWLYGLRFILAAAIPILLALPLLRYIRGKATLVALPLLLIITLLPVSTAVSVGQDLWEGPSVRQIQSSGRSELYLKYTDHSLGVPP